jgi:hypothetical protein
MPSMGNPQFGGQSSFGAKESTDPSPLDAIREQTSKIEDFLDTLSDPIKPYVLFTSSTRPPRPVLSDQNPTLSAFARSFANYITLQISPSYWTLLDCSYIFGGCAQNHDAVERPAALSPRLQAQCAKLSCTKGVC